jgi:hypothetical protein
MTALGNVMALVREAVALRARSGGCCVALAA